MRDALRLLLAVLADGGILDLGWPSPSRHETLRRAALPPEAREIFAAANLLHPETPGICLQRRGPVGFVLRRSDTCDFWRPVVLRAL